MLREDHGHQTPHEVNVSVLRTYQQELSARVPGSAGAVSEIPDYRKKGGRLWPEKIKYYAIVGGRPTAYKIHPALLADE